MIIVHGNIPLKPESREEALKLARVMATATQNEEGCISYDFYVGLSDPNTLLVFQEWESMDALMTHLSSPQVEAFLRQLPEISDGGITTRRYLVQEVEDSEAVVVVDQPPIIH